MGTETLRFSARERRLTIMAKKLDPKDVQMLATATALRNQRSYAEARELLNARIAQGLSVDDRAGLTLLAKIAALLIDSGSEGKNEQAIKDGLSLLENNRRPF